MKSPRSGYLFIALIGGTLLLLPGCRHHQDTRTSIRIGWQIPLATQGQIVEVLKKTDLLIKNGLEGKFEAFSYGGPQTEAALAGKLDVIFVGDQPAINLLLRGAKWRIVARLFYTRTAIVCPIDSPLMSMKDLKGRTVASPFGSVAHREATLKERAAGLNPDKDVKNINLDILEIGNLVQAGGKGTWGNIDAVGVWEPSTSLFEQKKLGRVLDSERTLGIVVMSEAFITAHREAAVDFLSATIQAWEYFSRHTEQVNDWYVEDARLPYSPQILASAARVEPNYAAKDRRDLQLGLSDDDIRNLEKAAAWSVERGYSKSHSNVRAAVDLSLLRDAERRLKNTSTNN
jgi:ABC-type nitrate/sulfonate/bicarbonate transport system substrate-binding protein